MDAAGTHPCGNLITEEEADLAERRIAVFDATRTYRYLLERRWADGPAMVFVMLNPSTAAAAAQGDPTIRRCLGFARRERASALVAVNLFALRSPSPSALVGHPDPVSPWTDAFIRTALRDAGLVVAAWGAHGALLGRDTAVAGMLAPHHPVCLGVTANGQPRHPLYLPADTPLTPYQPPARLTVPGAVPDPDGVPADLLALELEHRAEKQRVAVRRTTEPGACGYKAYLLGKQVAQHPWLTAHPVGHGRQAARKVLRQAATAAGQGDGS